MSQIIPRSSPLLRGSLFALSLASLLGLVACGGDSGTPIRADGGTTPDGGHPDATTDGGGGNPDGGTADGSTPTDGGDVMLTCTGPAIPATPDGTCSVTQGSAAILVRGAIVTPDGIMENGQVLISGAAATRGKIMCVACDCSGQAEASGATVIACANGVVSPGLINAHDHITFTEDPPYPHTTRYVHRHQWRKGQDGFDSIPAPSNKGGNNGIWWGEIRNLMAGGTSINGSGGAAGLLRNLDQPADLQEGLGHARVKYQTFPLKDSGGQRLTSGCNYGSNPALDSPTDPAISGAAAYTPHIAEGIDDTARNEFLCLSQDTPSSPDQDIIFNKTAIIHGVGLLAADYANMATDHASLIWSPRSNIDLYGNTAQVELAARLGVRVALGSDWAISGSMNMVRELHCADTFNKTNLGGYFTDAQILDMATKNAAGALGADDLLGTVAVGRFADLAIWNGATHHGYRAILDASPQDVVLVLRGGTALYGDRPVMSGLPDTQAECETMDVCGTSKLLCAERETGATTSTMKAALSASAYDLFFCGLPTNEPSCVPMRPGTSGYMGVPAPGDQDGDGVPDATDNCPTVFNPIRPLDGTTQPDADSDGAGDACDVCPLNANTTTCAPPDPNDKDGDGHTDASDNCPNNANADQADRDHDGIGDVCDACPDVANQPGQACPATIYAVKQAQATGLVSVSDGLVTAVISNGWFMQTVSGDASWDMGLQEKYSGVFVYVGTTATKAAVGDRVDVTGTAKDYHGEIELDASTGGNGSFTVKSSGNALPAPVHAALADIGTNADGVRGPLTEPYEAVLVEVGTSSVTDINPPRGTETGTNPINEYVIGGLLRVDDLMYLTTPFPQVGDTLTYVRGILRFAWDNYKLEPRSEADVGVTESLVALAPATLFVPAGTTGTGAGLEVVMNRPVSAAITVSLMSSSAGTTVPGTVVVPVGSDRAPVPLTVGAMERGDVTITASYDGVTKTAHLTVFDDTAPRHLAQFTLSPTTIATMAQAAGTIALDLPGRQTAGTPVTLAVMPANLATPSATTLTIPAGALTATFTLTTGTSTGAGTLVAYVGTSSRAIDFTVAVPTARTPLPGDLVITEIFRNPSGSNEKEREWFEVYNPTAADLILDGLVVTAGSRTFTVGANVSLPANGYGVFAYWADPAKNGGLQNVLVEYSSADLQLNNNTMPITLAFSGQTIDTVTYTSSWPGAGQDVGACLKAPYAADNTASSAWGNSTSTFGTGTAHGSPGLASDATNCQ